MIPLVDVAKQSNRLRHEILRRWENILGRGDFILGQAVSEFEQAFADFCQVSHCIGVANGTDALELAIRSLDIGPGDEVILPTNSFIATALAVARAGAKPVLVDCEPDYLLIDCQQLEAAVTERTRAILPVHLYGQMADMAAIGQVAERHGLAIIEDAAQAQGARQLAHPIGHFGQLAATSFYPGKNLGAAGDAGAVLTNDDRLAERIEALRNYGSKVKYHHPEAGFNSRLDTVQAAVLLVKLRHLSGWNNQRLQAANFYLSGLERLPVILPKTMSLNRHVWHLFVIRVEVDRRDAVLEYLNRHGIGAGIHYPVPIHMQGAFKDLGHKIGDFPVAEAAAAEMISLPLFPEITNKQQERVIDTLAAALREV